MTPSLTLYFSHPNTAGYKQAVYPALRRSPVCRRHSLVLPHEHSDQPFDTLAFFQKQAPILIADVTGKRFGVGAELGMATALGLDCHVLIRTGTPLAASARFLASQIHWYHGETEPVRTVENIIQIYAQKN